MPKGLKGFQKGHGDLWSPERRANWDKSFFKSSEYREKMRKIALARGYGKWMLGQKRHKSVGEKISKANMGHPPYVWSGDYPSYSALHKWLRAKYGRPDGCQNINCDRKSIRLEYALLHGKEYKRDRDNFIWLCTPCHRRYDKNIPGVNILVVK